MAELGLRFHISWYNVVLSKVCVLKFPWKNRLVVLGTMLENFRKLVKFSFFFEIFHPWTTGAVMSIFLWVFCDRYFERATIIILQKNTNIYIKIKFYILLVSKSSILRKTNAHPWPSMQWKVKLNYSKQNKQTHTNQFVFKFWEWYNI